MLIFAAATAFCFGAKEARPIPIPAFSASVTQGCAPLVVEFTDQSTGNPNNWNWDFGNGQLSSGPNHSITYTQPGVYSVTLVIRNASGVNSITKTDLIVVNAPPTVDFNASRMLSCAGSEVRFEDQTVPGDQSTRWTWDFGDGGTSDARNPSHIYTNAGTFAVKLTAVSADGCSATTTKRNYIQVASGITAAFDYTLSEACTPPFNVAFQNRTEGTGALNYNWSTGTGNTTATSPTIAYQQPGNYNVELIARDNYGCADTASQRISFKEIRTDFSFSPACDGAPVSFTNQPGEDPVSSVWYFGVGQTIRSANASYTFPGVGSYPVKLINTYAGCVDSSIQTVVVVAKPALRFSMNQRISCKVPFTINFVDNTPGATIWAWDFGDQTTSTSRSVNHTYNSVGNYNIGLTVTNGAGCTTSANYPNEVRITAPAVSITNSPGLICAQGFYRPTARVTAIEPVVAYLWDFGDGFTSTQAVPVPHRYVNTGEYSVTLTIRTVSGCTATTSGTVFVGSPALADFSTASSTVCPLLSVTFSALAPDPSVQYSWIFGASDTREGSEVQYNFSDTGRFNVTMTATNNGCPVSVTKEIVVTPPIARFTANVDCSGTRMVRFANQSIEDAPGGMNYQWDFGDPLLPPSSDPSPEIEFPAPGRYEVTLRASSATTQCSTSITQEVTIPSESLTFSASKTNVCRREIVELTANMDDPANANRYEWRIGNGDPVAGKRVEQISLDSNGTFDVSLRVTDVNGCVLEHNEQQMIKAGGPVAGFETSAIHCGDSSTIFIDTTHSALPVSSYKWNFGDGAVEQFITAPFVHHYINEGSYTASLIVTDEAGCADTTDGFSIAVSRPKALFESDNEVRCPGVSVNFEDHSSGNLVAWHWDFGDGITSNSQNAEYRYGTDDKDYTVTLKVTDQLGCSDSLSIDSAARIRNPIAYFDLADTAGICLPFVAQFNFKGEHFKSFFWDPGDGSTVSEARNFSHTYSRYGTFYPTLFVMGNGGCISTYSRPIEVANPANTGLFYNAPETCNELNVDFNIQPPAGTRFILLFGDGQADSSQALQISHLYESPAFYQPAVLLKDSAGCEYQLNGNGSIRVIGVQPFYGKSEGIFCDSGTVKFTNYSLGNDPVVSYNWNFGDGNVSSGASPLNTYASPGRFLPTLTTTTAHGCVDTYVDTVRVYATPHPRIESADTICVNAPVNFTASANHDDSITIAYNWTFSDGIHSTIAAPARRFNAIGSYSVALITSLPSGCTDSTSKPVYVTALEPLPPIPDQSTVNGQGIRLPATYTGDIIAYKWSPADRLSCDDCPNPVATPMGNTMYTVIASDRFGCQTSVQVRVNVSCSESNFYIPNTFSPNGDGSNDWFYPRGSGLTTIRMLQIFNRWGELVFENRNFAANAAASGWNGTMKGKPAIPDVYIYQIEVICENGQAIPFKGNVMLMR